MSSSDRSLLSGEAPPALGNTSLPLPVSAKSAFDLQKGSREFEAHTMSSSDRSLLSGEAPPALGNTSLPLPVSAKSAFDLQKASREFEAHTMSSSDRSLLSGEAPPALGNTSLPLPVLPLYIWEDISNRLGDAKDIARAQLLCRDWRDAGNNVTSLRITCMEEYHERARNNPSYEGKSFKSPRLDIAGPSTSGSSQTSQNYISFKELVVHILKRKHCIIQLRIEVEAKLQSKSVPEGEGRRVDFWLTEPYSMRDWLPGIATTLQILCIVDYGQQAIRRRSKILKILSDSCKRLKTLELRNLFIDTSDCAVMPLMESLTLRCVKVVSETLQHINEIMPGLRTLALLGVFGAEKGNLNFQCLKVLCLGLSTPAKDVIMNCPLLEKLQLKMQSPEKLSIAAPNLRYVAFNLDVEDPSEVELASTVGLRELLYGASSFKTLSLLLSKYRKVLEMLFLDVPCMALAEDGRFLGVLKDYTLQLPSFSRLHECEKLEVLNIGPGLWYSMESQVHVLVAEEKWPSMQKLILHMIPHEIEAAIHVLRMLLRTSVTSLLVFIHATSPVTEELMTPRIQETVDQCEQNISLRIFSWRKDLDFSCFSF